MSKTTLIVQTVYFSADDRADAEELGFLLYEYLTRSRRDKLAFGPGIPVRIAADPGRVDSTEADLVVVIPVLGESAAQDEDARDSVFTALNRWSGRPGIFRLLPVFTSMGWRAYEQDLPVKPLLQHLYDDQLEGFQHTLLELVISICNALRDSKHKPQIFISHAKLDLLSTKAAAEKIRDFAKTNASARAFYDTTDLESGSNLDAQLEVASSDGVFVAVRSDAYASRSWCQRELLWAKRSRIPTLTVEVLCDGEARSYPYGGNGPTIVWAEGENSDPDSNAFRVILRALVEWLRARHFEREVPRLSEGLPTPNVLPRPPELLDLAQGPLLETSSSVVMHPDPELSFAEQVVLKAARPRMQLITPTTRYRAVTSVHPTGGKSQTSPLGFAALRGRQVALSISNVIDDSLSPIGMRTEHLEDVVVYVTRALVGAGMCIAYGGDFRVGGFDQVLSDLISTYNAAGVDRANYVYSYLPASFPPGEVPQDIGVNIRSLGRKKFIDEARLKPQPGATTLGRAALYVSDMRRVMAKHCFARVLIGGQTLPRRNGEKDGYGGPYPGVVEEAWWTLKQGAPLYVVGGFGGAAALVAALAGGGDAPPLLCASSFSGDEHARFRQVAWEFAQDPELPAVGAPPDLESLVRELRVWLGARLQSDTAARAWNGLTCAENRELFWSRDVVRVTALIMKGQFNVLAAQASNQLKVELVFGNVARLEHADAVVLPTFRDVEVTGAGAALDAALNGAVSTARRDQQPLTQLNSSQIDADWLMLADLGTFATLDRSDLPTRIEERAKDVALLTMRHGFQRLALVTFAATILNDVEGIAARMLSGLEGLAQGTALQWFESDKKRFARLKAYLETRKEDVSLVVRELVEATPLPAPRLHEDAVAVVRLENGLLRSTLLLPSGSAVSQEQVTPVTAEDVEAMNQASSPLTPPEDQLATMGTALAQWLFGPSASLLDDYPDTRLVVQHDLASSALPFESLRIGNRVLGIGGGIVRRPSMTHLDLTSRLKRPPSTGKLKLLLIVNPTKNLENADTEADEIRKALADDDVELDTLTGDAASKSAVLAALADPSLEVVHFCGHAEYRADAPESGGLICAHGKVLTLVDLADVKLGPRIVFFNACQSARVRNQEPQAVSRALAEFVLRSGVEAFLGTFWPVADAAAGRFAADVYRHLAKGEQLDHAVLRARTALRADHHSDWANYALYGSGAFQLKAR